MEELEDSRAGTNLKCKSCDNPRKYECKHCNEPMCEDHARKKRGISNKLSYICKECYKTNEMLPKLVMLIACAVILVIFITVPFPIEKIWMVAVPVVMGIGTGGFAIAILIQEKITRVTSRKGGE